MKWHQLNESETVETGDLFDFINKNCKPYIQQNPDWLDHPLYRGIKSINNTAVIKPIRQDRKPVDTSSAMHAIYDTAMNKAGFTAIRSNSLFCAGDHDSTRYYGFTHIIMPIGNFSFSWSPEIRDLTGAFIYLAIANGIVFKNGDDPNILTPRNIREIAYDSGLNSYDIPEKSSFNDLIAMENNMWYSIQEMINGRHPLIDKLGLDMDVITNKFKELYQSGNMQGAIASGNEILISGDKYLAIPEDVYRQLRAGRAK